MSEHPRGSEQSSALVLPEPTDGWKNCRFCTPMVACSQHKEEAARYYDLVRRGAVWHGKRLTHHPAIRGYECASHEIEVAPGYQIFVSGLLDGRRQTIAVDPEEVDELTRRLHQAKRYARSHQDTSS